jgi:hypothetical protein
MTDRGESTPPEAEHAQPAAPSTNGDKSPEPTEPPNRGRSRKYGQVPVPDGASGRRARLRHPSRGAVRR